MFVRMAHWRCRPECWGDDQKLFLSKAVPIMQTHVGFEQAMLLGVPGDDARIAFTVWTDQVSYQQFSKSPDLHTITELFKHMYVGGVLPNPQEFEVRAMGGRHSQ